jgi:hypothetical protein
MEIPSCKAIEFLENLTNNKSKEIYVEDEKKIEKILITNKPIPRPMSIENKEKYLEKVKINVPSKECATNIFLLNPHNILQFRQT